MFPILLKVGPFTLHTYGLMVAVGFILALTFLRREFQSQGWPESDAETLGFVLLFVGIFGSRLFYFVENGFRELQGDPLAFFRIWEGGLTLYGGVVMSLIALGFYARRKKYSLLALADMCALPLLIGQAFGRLGCFSAGCCYGKPTASIFGVIFRNENSLAPLFVPLHPTQLYEFFGDMGLFAAGYFLHKKNPAGRGVLMCFYLIGYGLLRFVIEFLRGDDRGFMLQNLYPSQWIGLVSVLSGIILFIGLKGKNNA